MNKVIHQAVRRDLQRVHEALAALPEGDRERAAGIARAWDYLHSELKRHHEGEDAHVFPMLVGVGVDALLVQEMEAEHDAMAQALQSATGAVHQVSASATRSDADAAAAAVEQARVVTERHLDHEERELEPQLIPHFDSPEWKAAEKQLRKAPVGTAGRFFAWVQDGMTPEGREYLAKTVPPPVTFVLSRVFGRGYHREIAPVWHP